MMRLSVQNNKSHLQMKNTMFFSIHKLNRSTISIIHFNTYIFLLSQELKIKGFDYLQSYLWWRPHIWPQSCREIKFAHLNFKA